MSGKSIIRLSKSELTLMLMLDTLSNLCSSFKYEKTAGKVQLLTIFGWGWLIGEFNELPRSKLRGINMGGNFLYFG